MLMNLNSTVKMFPQEVKTPVVPDSEMCSTTGSAEYKRKAGPDASAAPYAKKIASSDALPKEDKTPLEDSSDITEYDIEQTNWISKMFDAFPTVTLLGHENAEDVLQGSDSPESEEESDMTDDEVDFLPPRFTTGDRVETVVRYTTEIGDFQALREKLASIHGRDSELYKKQYPIAVIAQQTLESTVDMACDFPVKMLRLQLAICKKGIGFAAGHGIREI